MMEHDPPELIGVTLISWFRPSSSRVGKLELRSPGQQLGLPKIVMYVVDLDESAVRAFVALVEKINGGCTFLEDAHYRTTSTLHFLRKGHSFDEVATFYRPA